mmetsp:Transcript_6291/g.17669  ORF Transcript_6291/g.17669 Transcript_6291/m.17669 type:complete len:197 (+) Transcript_6291:36-626(+)|eukprot:CAMPEP_0179248062 /NCGR_PEP_ID=MMETSP0797-20121207/19933_1 /TAXON_ID=47934 /ORGANISM="Dinophysis acuminata, Strain DAEP01" /LENGTH=196 /DNA_ID=CAMNT_0020955705 /DNA_START=30 /DNA_END=620 /DNA_ORIENTATION=+
MSNQTSLSGQIADLTQRVAACEAHLGAPCADGPSRLPTGSHEPSKASLAGCVAKLASKVDAVFKQEKQLVEFEKSMDSMEEWLQSEHASASHVVLHRNAKRNYVVQHAEQLQDFAKSLSEVESLRQYINPPYMQELPKHSEQLRKIDGKSVVTMGCAMKLHEQVAQISEEYHKTIVALNSQLLKWDSALSSKEAKS